MLLLFFMSWPPLVNAVVFVEGPQPSLNAFNAAGDFAQAEIAHRGKNPESSHQYGGKNEQFIVRLVA